MKKMTAMTVSLDKCYWNW